MVLTPRLQAAISWNLSLHWIRLELDLFFQIRISFDFALGSKLVYDCSFLCWSWRVSAFYIRLFLVNMRRLMFVTLRSLRSMLDPQRRVWLKCWTGQSALWTRVNKCNPSTNSKLVNRWEIWWFCLVTYLPMKRNLDFISVLLCSARILIHRSKYILSNIMRQFYNLVCTEAMICIHEVHLLQRTAEWSPEGNIHIEEHDWVILPSSQICENW